VPVPGCGVDQDLAGFQLAGEVKAAKGGNEGRDAKEEMDGVNAGDEIEEVAALVGLEEDVLEGELTPGDPLTAKEEEAQCDGCGDPGQGAAGDRFSEA